MGTVGQAWYPRAVETTVLGVCAVLAAGLALVADPAGRVLFAVAAVGLAAVTATDLLVRPRLAATPAGVEVRTLVTHRRFPWTALERIAVDEHTRRGLTARTLELEAGGELIILSKRTLGEDPRDVADALARIRYTGT